MKNHKAVDNIHGYIKKDNLLHTYGLEGGREVCDDILNCLEKEYGISVVGNPDVHLLCFDEGMGIGEARILEGRSGMRAFTSNPRFFVVFFESITHEAQNALLKLLEEPSPNAHFFLITPLYESLLPTLRSRLFHIPISPERKPDDTFIIDFVKAKAEDRILFLKDIIDKKDKAQALSFLNNLEVYLHSTASFGNQDKGVLDSLRNIEQARGYLGDRAPSVKMLLEYVALTTPQI